MKRVFNKSISFTLFLIIFLVIVAPYFKIYAYSKEDYMLMGLTSMGYSDGVKYGDGYLLLKNGKFNNINSNTTYTYVDSNGNTKEIKNNIGFTEIYLNTSGSTYYVDYGVLAVGKNGKVALIDIDGKLYGGSTNFYECVIHAGENLFYTTDATKNQEDKGNTTIWTLRRKDGSVVKEFKNLNFYTDRTHSNGYEYINSMESNQRELICVDSIGNIKLMGKGYERYTVYSEYGYILAYKKSNSNIWGEYTIDVFKENGDKVFSVEKCNNVEVDGLYNYGYARVSTNYNGEVTQNLIDLQGNYVFEKGKYATISGYDDKKASVIDYNENIYLVDYKDNTIFDVDDFVKRFGEYYKAITSSSYYIDSTLTFTIMNKSNKNDIGKSFFFDDNGNEISGNIDGRITDINGFNGSYALLYNSSSGSYGVVEKTKELYKDGYEYLQLQNDPNESDVVGIAENNGESKILVMKNGKDIDKYDAIGGYEGWIYVIFLNGHAIVKNKGKEEYGVIDIHGNEIIQTGEYNNFRLYNNSEVILGYKDNKPYLFDKNGKVINDYGKYKNIGDYKTEFYKFSAGKNYIEYTDNITSNNVTIVRDYNGNIGLVKVVKNINTSTDLNNDGKVDIEDMASLALKYNYRSTDKGWEEKFDLNKDGIIDIFDLVVLSKDMKS